MDDAKRERTLDELKALYDELTKHRDTVKEQLDQKMKEEEDKKKAELESQKEKRMEEIETAQKHLNELYKSYIADYGYLKMETTTDDYDWFPSFWRYNFWF